MDVTNNAKAQEFVKAIEEKDLATACDVFYIGDAALKKYCGGHLFSLGGEKLFELFNGANDYFIEVWILGVIIAHGDQQLVDNALETLKPDDVPLSSVMYSAPLACNTTRFISLLKTITDKEDQERAVRNGVTALVEANEPECFDSLISALRSESTFDSELVNVAIRGAFRTAIFFGDQRSSFVKRVFGHLAIDAKSYAGALYRSHGRWGPESEILRWLLARATHLDLKEAEGDPQFFRMSSGFREIICDALKNVGDETRSQKNERILREMTKPFRDPLGQILPKDLITMVLKYYPER